MKDLIRQLLDHSVASHEAASKLQRALDERIAQERLVLQTEVLNIIDGPLTDHIKRERICALTERPAPWRLCYAQPSQFAVWDAREANLLTLQNKSVFPFTQPVMVLM